MSAYKAEAKNHNSLINGLRSLLTDVSLDKAFVAYCLEAPSLKELTSSMKQVDPTRLYLARRHVTKAIVVSLKQDLLKIYLENKDAPGEKYVWNTANSARRSLKNMALRLLMSIADEDPALLAVAWEAYSFSTNMTDTIGALTALNAHPTPERKMALEAFYNQWHDDNTVILHWFRLSAGASFVGNTAAVQGMLDAKAIHNLYLYLDTTNLNGP